MFSFIFSHMKHPRALGYLAYHKTNFSLKEAEIPLSLLALGSIPCAPEKIGIFRCHGDLLMPLLRVK